MAHAHVETMSAGFQLLHWPAASLEEAEQLAHDLSISAWDEPSLPNPFLVVDGTLIAAAYDRGMLI